MRKKTLSPAARRAAAREVVRVGLCSQRAACRILRLARSTFGYQGRDPTGAEELLRKRLRELSVKHPRYGYRRIAAVLRREGWPVGKRHIQGLRRAEGLRVPPTKRKQIRRGLSTGLPTRATHRNHVWTWDFIADATVRGGALRMLTILDEHTRECHVLRADRALRSQDVLEWLQKAIQQHGAPNSSVDMITDVYGLGGVTLFPGTAPYSGPFVALPGSPVIGSTPGRTQGSVAGAVAGNRQLAMHALQFRAGPTLDWLPNDKWSVGVQGGLALGVGFSQLSFAEQITVADPTVPVISQSGRSSDAHFWAGLFSSVRVSRQFGENWRAHVEVRHLLTDKFQHAGPTRSAEINLSDGLSIAAGLSYRF